MEIRASEVNTMLQHDNFITDRSILKKYNDKLATHNHFCSDTEMARRITA